MRYLAVVSFTLTFLQTLAFAETLRVGVVLPLSGPLAEYGVAIRNGIDLAREHSPKRFRNIDFHYEDSRYQAKEAISAYRRLRAQYSTPLIYNFGSPTSEALAPIVERDKVTMLALTQDPAVSFGRKHVLRFVNPPEQYGAPLSKYLAEKRLHRIAVVLTENQYLRSMLDGLKQTISPEQEITIIQTYSHADQDFRTAVSKLSRGHFDAVGVFLLSGQVSQFYSQMKAQDVKLPSFGTDFFESRSEIRNAKGQMESAVFANNIVSEVFREAYFKRFGGDHQISYAGLSYDFAMLLAERFAEHLEPLGQDSILLGLSREEVVNGVCGNYLFQRTLSGDKYFKFPIALRQVQGFGVEQIVDPKMEVIPQEILRGRF